MGYARHASGMWTLNNVVVRDPWPGVPYPRRSMSPQEVYNVGFWPQCA
jgi:hypothetical protein